MSNALLSISKLFTERLYRIPDYQRGYAWQEKHLKDFWNDLISLEDGKSHYAGVLTLEDVPPERWKQWEDDIWIVKSKGFSPFYVVDGQQRLTTTVILIQCVIESLSGITQKLNYQSGTEIRKKYIYDFKDSGIARSYIFGYEKDNPSFEFLKREIFGERSEGNRTLEETVYTENLRRAKSFFAERFSTLPEAQREQAFRQLTHNFLFNVYEIQQEIDVFVAFETMNNRGKPLSQLELLKNRLIFLTTRLNSYPQADAASLRGHINDCWRSVYHHLGKNKTNPLDDDYFLFTHFVLYFGKTFLRNSDGTLDYYRLPRMFRGDYGARMLDDVFTTRNLCQKGATDEERKSKTIPLDISAIHRYIVDLKSSVEIWFDILNPFESAFDNETKLWLDRLFRISGPIAAPLLLSFFQRQTDRTARLELIRALEQLTFLSSFVGRYYTFEREIFLPSAIEIATGETPPDRALRQLQNNLEEFKKNGKILEAIHMVARRSNGFYEWPGLRHFLYEYEQSLRDKSKTTRSKIAWSDLIEPAADHVSVEHIYPQNARDECWTRHFGSLTAKQKNMLRHSIGNLLPLSVPKNASLQNKCFAAKKEKSNSTVGYRYGSFSENEVATISEWTPLEIWRRGERLLQFLENRWSIQIGPKKDWPELLGLAFVQGATSPSTVKSRTKAKKAK